MQLLKKQGWTQGTGLGASQQVPSVFATLLYYCFLEVEYGNIAVLLLPIPPLNNQQLILIDRFSDFSARVF